MTNASVIWGGIIRACYALAQFDVYLDVLVSRLSYVDYFSDIYKCPILCGYSEIGIYIHFCIVHCILFTYIFIHIYILYGNS